MADETVLAEKARDAIQERRATRAGGEPHLRRAGERRHLRGLRRTGDEQPDHCRLSPRPAACWIRMEAWRNVWMISG